MSCSIWYACFFAMFFGSAQAQTSQLTVKVNGWTGSDFTAIELRIKGRLFTETAGTHKILGRIKVNPNDWMTILSPKFMITPSVDWEVKSLSVHYTPVASTGLAAWEVPTRRLATPHRAPAGQLLVIEGSYSTGIVLIGPLP